jgi:hypothetical protein
LAGYLTARSCDAIAAEVSGELAARLTVTGAGSGVTTSRSAGAKSRPADRAAVIRLIQDLLDDAQALEFALRAVYTQRAIELDQVNAMAYEMARTSKGDSAPAEATPFQRVVQRAAIPSRRLAFSQQVGVFTAMAEALEQSDWSAAFAKLPPRRGFLPPNRASAPAVAWLNATRYNQWSYAVEYHFSALTERRAAAVLLALRLYQLDRAGRFPATLAELCPTYLSRVPIDPMAPGGKTPLGYGRRGGTAFVYSFGSNARDDTVGGWIPTTDDYRNMRALDYVVSLNRAAATTMPAPLPQPAPASDPTTMPWPG